MSESTTAPTTVDKVTTVMVPVADQDRAIEFYTEKMGFEKRADIPFGDGNRWVEVAPAGAATTVALVQPMEGEGTGVESRIAFRSTDIDADHAALRERGVEVDPEVMRMGGPVPPMFFFRDVDGNRLLLVETD
ncbi:MAG TPA: VOC family protein [Solirubrobacterales bacterium]|jgi:catechol 2,3-dioxygenase-like lactoylglutathione lyase family enzyme